MPLPAPSGALPKGAFFLGACLLRNWDRIVTNGLEIFDSELEAGLALEVLISGQEAAGRSGPLMAS